MSRSTEEQRKQYEVRGPDKAYEIPKSLYEKAEKHNDQLTDDERALLLSRGDVVGKALANPKSLTEAELYQVIRWSPPELIQPAIRKATGGVLSKPLELIAKVREAKESGQLHTLSFEELKLVYRQCLVGGVDFLQQSMSWFEVPGNTEAKHLMSTQRQRDHGTVTEDEFRHTHRAHLAAMRSYSQNRNHRAHPYSSINRPPMQPLEPRGPSAIPTRPFPPAPQQLPMHPPQPLPSPFFTSPPIPGGPAPVIPWIFNPGHVPQSAYDRNRIFPDGSLAWPPAYHPKVPMKFFAEELRAKIKAENLVIDDFWHEAGTRFNALTVEERAPYEEKIEALRQKAWHRRWALSQSLVVDYDDMTVEICADYCLDQQGQTMFGLEYGGECYCSDELQSGSVLVDDEDCNMACPGNAAEMCGAGNRLSVYQKT
ncbi:WSC domain-containing protein [Phialemonium atrogriseum]|uniref:WSC domain-containing protein n=1 Tax=Phialemonium atrogriseum TaxID=1093897 RepID=A0AAJ0FIJ4_9PEZI|nr:WSC domain-containing protein [Phialemonium atrogriseum]KAK1762165.1 WSC domain-containing protein [Phialemonium atrogriseum]